ncbi:LAETG motif-containing sortase-dependent surface protein [Streptomyces sp. TRM 70361]|uniref:LAETG motif-containing sortase-dependent surface protein n=1 Tax=Streptomyces sp. TRM 70361 TaxID=3116553 RepID=UPI002E7B92AB|nr:LAETG motif-containing sortase-dependent surface protein [Streptomyces sp. TRM 70361]MEE1942272.1 LAETG motif-containing sortase-dependent surface protein [Streptomyces sp. TRM 70361]
MPIVNRTAARLLGTGAIALALSVGGVATAGATNGGDGWDRGKSAGFKPGKGAGKNTAADECVFSLDGEKWQSSVRVDNVNLKPTEDGTVHIHVKAAKESGTCTASLAAYRTHGPTWETSGEQVFHDFDTVSLKGKAVDTLDISVPDEGCYAQIDLYRGSTRFDGGDGPGHGPLPVGPDRPVIKDKLIAAWNGGTRECLEETPPPSPSAPETPSETPPETPPGNEESTPPAETEPPSESASPVPSAPETPGGESPQAPEASEPAAEPSESALPSGGGDLAETGSSNVAPLAGGAAVLLLAGGGVLFAVRRRRAAGN